MTPSLTPEPRRTRNRRRASVLVLVLWAVVILSVIGLNFAFLVKTHLRLATNHSEAAALRNLARGGVEYGIAVLREDTDPVDHLGKSWAYDSTGLADIPLGGGAFSLCRTPEADDADTAYGIEDEAAKLNLHTATQEMLQRLRGMDQTRAAALIAWQDEATTTPQGLAEDDHYRYLSPAYPCRHAKLDTVAELRLVRGFDVPPEDSEDWQNAGEFAPPIPSTIPGLDADLLRLVTIYSSDRNVSGANTKRVNVASASEEDLKKGIPGLTDDEARAIVAHRKNGSFENIGDLLEVREALPGNPQQRPGAQPGGGGSQGPRSAEPGTPGAGEPAGGGSGIRIDRSGMQANIVPGSIAGSTSRTQPTQPQRQGREMIPPERLKQIVDYCAISDEEATEGRINVNTAPAEVLMALPGVNEDLARAIAAQRAKSPFPTIAHLLDVPGLSRDAFKKLSNLVTVRSYQFRIRSEAHLQASAARHAVEAIVERGGTRVKILYWNEE